MAATRRTQLLMEPEEFRRLRVLARQKNTSVAGLIRSAVRQVYFPPQPDRAPVVEAILQMRLPAMSWKRVKKDIERDHAGLP
jgi:hypothetical protein